jgi:hypothetical protein
MCTHFSHRVLYPIMNSISMTYYSCERKEYVFICTPRLLKNHSFFFQQFCFGHKLGMFSLSHYCRVMHYRTPKQDRITMRKVWEG